MKLFTSHWQTAFEHPVQPFGQFSPHGQPWNTVMEKLITVCPKFINYPILTLTILTLFFQPQTGTKTCRIVITVNCTIDQILYAPFHAVLIKFRDSEMSIISKKAQIPLRFKVRDLFENKKWVSEIKSNSHKDRCPLRTCQPVQDGWNRCVFETYGQLLKSKGAINLGLSLTWMASWLSRYRFSAIAFVPSRDVLTMTNNKNGIFIK